MAAQTGASQAVQEVVFKQPTSKVKISLCFYFIYISEGAEVHTTGIFILPELCKYAALFFWSPGLFIHY